MALKFGSIVFAIVSAFIMKISIESFTQDRPQGIKPERSTASIDKSYIDYNNKR